jgi:hypothetical protein
LREQLTNSELRAAALREQPLNSTVSKFRGDKVPDYGTLV